MRLTCRYDIIIKKIDFGLKLLYNQNLIINDGKSVIKSLSLLTGEYEWEIDLSQYGEIRKIIGVIGDSLWVSFNDLEYGQHHLLVISTQSGKVEQSEKQDSRFADFGVLLTEQDTILSLKGAFHKPSWLYEYDAKSHKMLRCIEVSSLKEKKLGVKAFTVYGDYIYFIATDDTQILANFIGTLDYKTLDLLWFEKAGDFASPPQVSDTHLYVLDTESTLHIFEKENIE